MHPPRGIETEKGKKSTSKMKTGATWGIELLIPKDIENEHKQRQSKQWKDLKIEASLQRLSMKQTTR